MKIYSVYDSEFAAYGEILDGYDLGAALDALSKTPATDEVVYVPSEPTMEVLPFAQELRDRAYGGMPIQLGWCNGKNTKLNCLEYHRGGEMNLGTEDFILLLAKMEDIIDGKLDTAKVKAFHCPKGVMIDVYETSLHYAPCSAAKDATFHVMVALPLGTNTDKPAFEAKNAEDTLLWARNKWLLAHGEAPEAANGAYVGLVGENIDICEFI